MQWLDKISLPIIGILVATLGLAPYLPQPHVVEKLGMLFAGELSRPIDIFDLFLHGTPLLLLLLKLLSGGHAR